MTVSIREGEHGMLISVDDSGAGIAADKLDRIFERGFSTKGEGRGTGLSLVKETVDAFHGTIRVESEPGNWQLVHHYGCGIRKQTAVGRKSDVHNGYY